MKSANHSFRTMRTAFPIASFVACSSMFITQPFAAETKQAIVPQSLQKTYEEAKYSPAIRVGDMLYLSGVVANVKESDEGDISLAIERAFDDIELILSEVGASWNNVVDVTSYMTDLDQQIGTLWAVKEKRVPAPYPAWTAIGVSRLFGGDSAIIEIKVVAHLAD